MKPFPRLFLILPALAGSVVSVCAQYNPFGVDVMGPEVRAGRFESYLLGQYWSLEESTIDNVTLPTEPGPNPPTVTADLSMDFDDAGLFGFGLAYHLNNHFAIRGEFTFGHADYEASHGTARATGEAALQGGKFTLDYNVLEGKVTPVVSAGLGYLFVDSGIVSGPPDYYCWWDAWWGYVCTGAYPTYSKTYFTLHAAAGVRWEISDTLFAQATGGAQWVDTGGQSGWLTGVQAVVSLGWMF